MIKKQQIIKIKCDSTKTIDSITTNVIFNRFDILYGDAYDIWTILCEKKEYVVPVHYDFRTQYIYLGLYLVNVPENCMTLFIETIEKHYPKIKRIYLDSSSYKNKYLKKDVTHYIILPPTQEAFCRNISSKTKKHIKQYIRRISEELGTLEICHVSRSEITHKIGECYFKYKEVLYSVPQTYTTPEEYLDYYHVTDAYLIKINNEVEAVLFTSVTDSNVFLENLTYNPDKAKYSLGTLIYYETILDLIKEGKKMLLLGGGNYEYKYRFGAEHITTYSGYIPLQYFDKIKRIITVLIIRLLDIIGEKNKKKLLRLLKI